MIPEVEKNTSSDVGMAEEFGEVDGCDWFGESFERNRFNDKPVGGERRCANNEVGNEHEHSNNNEEEEEENYYYYYYYYYEEEEDDDDDDDDNNNNNELSIELYGRRREKRVYSINNENRGRIEWEKGLRGNMHGLKKVADLIVIQHKLIYISL